MRSLLGRIQGTRHLVRYTGKFVISGVHYTERICEEFVRQNPRDQTFSSLNREVRYIRGSLYRENL